MKLMKKYSNRIAYQGSKFVIEWYVEQSGDMPALDYFLQQSPGQQDKLINLMRLMGEMGKIFDETKFRNEGDGIYAFKPQPDRYLCCFFRGGKIIVTNAF